MKSLIAYLGNQQFPRLRIGIGRGERQAIDHVLAPFTPEESASLAPILASALDGIELWLGPDPLAAVHHINTSKGPVPIPPPL
jgi:PTH1 family peptidyl-tRNA hydrolase